MTLITSILSSPNTLYTTSITSFLIARFIIHRVKNHRPIRVARTIMKYNSIIYSAFSLVLFFGILTSFWVDISSTPNLSLRTLICSPSTSILDQRLRYTYHASKFYEYIDIFNVLAVGSVVNTHFWFHHFTTPYLTYFCTIHYPAGWRIFAGLNTLHHAFMYAYFGGATIFSDLLPWTGYLQLIGGMLGEVFIVRRNLAGGDCGGDMLWANGVGLGLLGVYAVLFVEEVRGRGMKGKREDSEGEKGKKKDWRMT